MTTLLVGFDSAWTRTNSGALVGVLRVDDGTFRELGSPQTADYLQAANAILDWQTQEAPAATIVLLDQPTIVKNALGQRPVENIVGSPVSRRYGGMQPANTGRREMFGFDAPVWQFLAQFGGPADPLAPLAGNWVVETYPVLAMMALGWTLPDSRPAGRLPKYNPMRRKTFSLPDWQHVCRLTSSAFGEHGLDGVVRWLDDAGLKAAPRKSDQDRVDACLCLLTAVHLAEGRECLMIGDQETGYIVVPFGENLYDELKVRCETTGRAPGEWVRSFHLAEAQPGLRAIARCSPGTGTGTS